MMTDCSVHRSYFRAISIHDAFNLKVERNTAFDISGHAFYLGERKIYWVHSMLQMKDDIRVLTFTSVTSHS